MGTLLRGPPGPRLRRWAAPGHLFRPPKCAV